MIGRHPQNSRLNIVLYFKSGWNWFDLLGHLFMFTSIALRCSLNGEKFEWARDFYAVTLIIFYLRTLNIFYKFKSLGPLVIVIKRMVSLVTVIRRIVSLATVIKNMVVSWLLLMYVNIITISL